MRSALLLACLLASCTTYKEFDPVTGRKTIAFTTNANIGITTSKVDESDSSTTGGAMPIVGGGYRNDTLTEAKENSSPASLTIGQLALNGTIDHSTIADEVGGWTWRTVRSIITGTVFREGISAWEADKLATTGAEVSKSQISAGTTQAVDANATAVAIKKIDSETAIALEPAP